MVVINVNDFDLFVLDLANKSQTGYFDPDQRNRAYQAANREVFMRRFGNPHDYQPGQPIPRMAWEQTRKISDDLLPFLTTKSVAVNANGEAAYPSDYCHASSLWFSHYVNPENCDDEKALRAIKKRVRITPVQNNIFWHLSNSSLNEPTGDYPFCAFYGDKIQFLPLNLKYAILDYLKIPADPVWGSTVVNNEDVYDPTTSTNFEWPTQVFNELAVCALQYLGVSIREADLFGYTKEAKEAGV